LRQERLRGAGFATTKPSKLSNEATSCGFEVLDRSDSVISGASIQRDRKGPAQPLLDRALREPACQVFQDAVMIIQLALQLQAAILDGGLLLVEFPLDLQ
jgi:hypothetical protein